jgi:hypothetical protein
MKPLIRKKRDNIDSDYIDSDNIDDGEKIDQKKKRNTSNAFSLASQIKKSLIEINFTS